MMRAIGIVVCAVGLACVPRGEPPAGQQVVADRTTTLVGMVRPNGDGVARVLISRPVPNAQNQQLVDLYVVSAAPGEAPVERLLAANAFAGGTGGCQLVAAEPFCRDSRGRLFVMTDFEPTTGFVKLARIDAITGERVDLGTFGTSPFLSASGERLLIFPFREGPVSGGTLYELDGRVVPLEDAAYGWFYGEVVYYATTQQELWRVAPGGVPERLATDVTSFSPATSVGPLLLMLTRATADPMVFALSILDPVTLEEEPLPVDGFGPFSLSPSGRWLLTYDNTTFDVILTDRITGTQDRFSIPDVQVFGASGLWRPGHDEVWFPTGYQEAKIWIKKPGEQVFAISGTAQGFAEEVVGGGTIFTRDGAYWFSTRGPVDEPIVQVGSADDPTGPRFDLAPAGTRADSYWRLTDGRILTAAYVKVGKRKDLYAVDPATGQSRVLGEAGLVVAVGQTRLLANLHINDSRGDLTAVDLATGQPTLLAAEFTMAAVVERDGADVVAPGAHVAYQFQARFVSPFDGIWVATIP